jgi:adenine phosphoribosyltransferase
MTPDQTPGPMLDPSQDLAEALRAAIVNVPDFPRPGVGFKDITPVLHDVALFRRATAAIADHWRPVGVTHVLAIESRGFLFGAPVAQALGVPLVPVRKPGKLPRERVTERYALEYGTDALELHADAVGAGARALIVDDVLATGGTAAAAARLAERCGAEVVGLAVVIDLSFLPWRDALSGRNVHALVRY